MGSDLDIAKDTAPAAKPAPKAPARWRWALKIGGSLALLALVFAVIPAGEVWQIVSRLSPLVWLAAFAGFLAGHVLAAAKWGLLIGAGPGFVRVLKAHFAGLAANLALPGVSGGDIVRAGLLMNVVSSKARLALAALIDRLIDIAVLFLLAALGALALGFAAPRDAGAILLAGLTVITAGGIGLMAMGPVARLLRARLQDGEGGAARVLRSLAEALEAMSRERLRVLLAILLSAAIQALFIALTVMIAAALGAYADPAAWLFAWPLAKIIATLPISLAGLGVREAALATLLNPYGAAAAGVVAASLVWQSVLFAAGLVGALAQLAGRPAKPGREAVSP